MCDHTVGIHYDYSDTDLVNASEIEPGPREWYQPSVNDTTFFDYCPDCGENIKELVNALKMVQMPR